MKVHIDSFIISMLEFYAAESHPLEVSGKLVGWYSNNEWHIDFILPFTSYEIRTKHSLKHIESDALADDRFSDYIIGGFHSHPDAPPTLSRESDLSKSDKEAGVLSDFQEMHDGNIEWIVGVYPGKRKNWKFKHKAYVRLENKIRVLTIKEK